jgi:2-aminoadipate transaminase
VAVKLDVDNLLSDIARSGPPLFFPDPESTITFNFDQGVAAEETFPMDELKALAAEILDRDGPRALEYISFGFDPSEDRILYIPTFIELVLGHTGLREEVARWVGTHNGRADLDADSIMLGSGSVQVIALAINAFLDAGEGAIVESATFPYAQRFMEMRGANITSVALDRDGMITEELERRLRELQAAGSRPKLIYTVPTFQLPTCVCMPLDRRRRLVELAQKWGVVVIEDAVYSDLRYSGEPVPSLLSLDDSGVVIQAHSFSKNFVPGIRIGWMAGDHDMIAGMAAVRQDLGVSQWLSRMMAEYLRRGRLDPHIERANRVYRRKRDVAAQAVRDHCAPWVRFDLPDGGFYLWLELSDEVDWEKARQEAVSGGVLCRPGEVFMGREAGARYLRLAYSHVSLAELERGIAVLGKAISTAAG